jgi:hypothetical protein
MTQGTITLRHSRIAGETKREASGDARPRRRRNPILEFMAAAISARGGEPSRETDRMFRDLQAAQGARESGR